MAATRNYIDVTQQMQTDAIFNFSCIFSIDLLFIILWLCYFGLANDCFQRVQKKDKVNYFVSFKTRYSKYTL